jgi:hypothetical protein
MPRPPWVTIAAVLAGCLFATVLAGLASVANALGPDADADPPAAAAPATQATAPETRHLQHHLAVRPLRHLHAPDAVVVLRHPARPHQVVRLRHATGIRAASALDRGVVHLGGRRYLAAGVDPSAVRGFTPSLTARSDALWQAVARGEMAVSYAESHGLRHRLGATLPVKGRHHRHASLRVGAFASLGLGRAQLVVDRADARQLGLHRAKALVVSAPKLTIDTIAGKVRRVFGAHATVHSARPQVVREVVSDYARATIPASYFSLYRAAAGTCAGLPWTVLAAIGAVETGHGANVHRSTKGAVGPMQFLPSTFASYGIDGDGDGVADIHNPADAVYSAARYLCLWGAGRGGQALYDAVWAYNHADWYVRMVFNLANAYA